MKEYEFEVAATFIVRADSEEEAENKLREFEGEGIHWGLKGMSLKGEILDSGVHINNLTIGNVKEYEIE